MRRMVLIVGMVIALLCTNHITCFAAEMTGTDGVTMASEAEMKGEENDYLEADTETKGNEDIDSQEDMKIKGIRDSAS